MIRPSPSSAASLVIRCASPRRWSSASRPSSPTSESRTELGRPVCSADDSDSGSAGLDARSGIRHVDAADCHDRNRDRLADGAQPLEADCRVGVGLARRHPDWPGTDVGRSFCLGGLGLPDAGCGAAEHETRCEGLYRAWVIAAEVDTVRVERDRGLHVVVDDERRADPAEPGAPGDDLLGGRSFEPQLDDRGAALRGAARSLEIADERVKPHSSVRARSSNVSGSRLYSASYSPAWKVPGPWAARAAFSPATPKATSASAAASSGAPGFAARKQPVTAVAIQPVPLTVPRSSWPFETAITRSPSETLSVGPVTAATQPSATAASVASSSAESSAPIDSTPRISAFRPASVAISAALPRTTAMSSSSRSRLAVSVR